MALAEPAWPAAAGTPAARPLVIAHRGASATAPENTLAAFRAARAEAADGVELDVMRCATGELVVFHDDDLARLCGRPEAVRAVPWALLAEQRVGGEPIPQLAQVLDELGPLLVNVELKSAPDWKDRLVDDGLAAEVAALLARHPAGRRALVSSFDPLLLLRFGHAARRLRLTVPTALLFGHDQARPLREAWSAPVVRPRALHPEAALVDAAALARWRARGYAVNVWTVDDPAELRALAALGVDGVITNRPARTRAVLTERP